MRGLGRGVRKIRIKTLKPAKIRTMTRLLRLICGENPRVSQETGNLKDL